MKTRYIFLTVVAAAALSSCNDFLDISPTDKVTDKAMWSSVSNGELAVNYFYNNIGSFGSFGLYQCYAGLTEGLTDEMKYGNYNYNSLCLIPSEFSYGGSVLTSNYVDVYMGVWGSTYTQIRRVNEALGYLHNSGFSESDTKRLEGELRFFRGLYYFELMKRYHQAIIYGEDLNEISTDKPLNTEAEGWQYVLDDLTYAGENLPVSNSATGRLTSGAAYGLLSRAMLYCENWAAAKSAAEKVFEMGYSLCADYADAFKSADNSEAILAYQYNAAADVTHDFNNYYAPPTDKANGMTTTGGYGTPTQDMVEEYEYASGGLPDWSTWHNTDGTMQQPPYDQLEPRFQATILYNGASWRDDRTIEPYIGGADGWAEWQTEPAVSGRTTTGYYLRKLVDEAQDYSHGSVQPWIAIRLAEIYLNYAEACYRTGDNTTAMQYVNLVRARVGLPEVSGLSGDNLMAVIRHERKVELAYEGQYYWDMRRWGLSTTAFTGTRRHGLKIEAMGGSYRYTYVECDRENMNYPSKLNRLPIPQDELNNNKDIEQFTEWK